MGPILVAAPVSAAALDVDFANAAVVADFAVEAQVRAGSIAVIAIVAATIALIPAIARARDSIDLEAIILAFDPGDALDAAAAIALVIAIALVAVAAVVVALVAIRVAVALIAVIGAVTAAQPLLDRAGALVDHGRLVAVLVI